MTEHSDFEDSTLQGVYESLPCFNCGRLEDARSFTCGGCGAVVCTRCDRASQLSLSHLPEDHLELPEEPEEPPLSPPREHLAIVYTVMNRRTGALHKPCPRCSGSGKWWSTPSGVCPTCWGHGLGEVLVRGILA